MKNYLNIKMPAYARLATLRGMAVLHNEKRPPSLFKTWRDMRACGFHNARAYCGGLSQGLNNKRPIWYCHTGEQFRNERDVNEVLNTLRYMGWYTDIDGNETAIGIVGMLSHGRYIAGYRWTSNDERVYFPDVFDDEITAARFADSSAENFAELAREDDEKFQAAQKLESDIGDNFIRLRECIALRNKKCMDYIRHEITELCEAIREARDTLRTDYKDYI